MATDQSSSSGSSFCLVNNVNNVGNTSPDAIRAKLKVIKSGF